MTKLSRQSKANPLILSGYSTQISENREKPQCAGTHVLLHGCLCDRDKKECRAARLDAKLEKGRQGNQFLSDVFDEGNQLFLQQPACL